MSQDNTAGMSQDKGIIRRAVEGDTDTVLELLRQVGYVHHVIRPDLFGSGTKYTAAELQDIFSDDTKPVFVYEEEGRVLGYLFACIIDQKGANILRPCREFYIDDLCVDENFRGRHVASRLYGYALNYAREGGCHNVTLNVWEGNDGALSFYRAMGMKTQKTKLECIVDNPEGL